MKSFVLLVASVSIVHAAGGAAPGSAKAWEEEQARNAQADRFDSSGIKGPRPNTEIQFGVEQAWFADWDLGTHRSPSGPQDRSSIPRNMPRFLGIFDARGWISELRYIDARGNHRWSRAYTYKMPGTVSSDTAVTWIVGFYDRNGEPLELDAQEKAVRDNGLGWELGRSRLEVHDVLGDPLTVFPAPGGGETWTYFDGRNELKFGFDRKGKLIEAPKRP